MRLTDRKYKFRDEARPRAGIMFSDADLLGIPFRIIVSPRNMKQGIVEMISRDKSFSADLPMEGAGEELSQIMLNQNFSGK